MTLSKDEAWKHAFEIEQTGITYDNFYAAKGMVDNEVRKACEKFPWWPVNVFAGQAVVTEECGEACKATLDIVQKPEQATLKLAIKEHAQAAAMHIRQMQYLLYVQTQQEAATVKEVAQ